MADFEAEFAGFLAGIEKIEAKAPEPTPAATPAAAPAPHANSAYAPDQVHLYHEPVSSAVARPSVISSAPVLHKKRKKTDNASKAKKKSKTEESAEVPPWELPTNAPPPQVVIPGDLVAVQAQQRKKEIAQAQEVAVKEKKKDPHKYLRTAAGEVWEDTTLCEWPENDFRIFVGDLGNEVNDNSLGKIFQGYASFNKAKVIRDKKTQKTKGYGFVSFGDPYDCANALRECQGKYCGNRPIKLRRSNWQSRGIQHNVGVRPRVKKRNRKKRHLF